MGAKEPDTKKVSNSRPMAIPADIYDRLEKCKIFPTESFGSVIDRHINVNEVFHMLLDNPEKVLETIRKVNKIIEARGEISPVIQKPELIRILLRK